MWPASVKPWAVAISSSGRRLVSTAVRAASSRRRSTAFAGVVPVSAAKARAKFRGLIAAASASRSTVSRSPRWARIHSVRPAKRPGRAADLEEGGELRLPARPALVDDELLRDAADDGGPEVVLDQREREVDPRGDAGGGPDVAVPHVDAVGVDADLRIAAAETVGAVPVRGRAPSVEEPCRREQEGAGADARHAPRAHLLQPADDLRRGRGVADDLAARDDHRVDGLRRQRQGGEAGAGRALDLPVGEAGGRADQAERVGPGREALGELEGGDRAGGVEQLEARMKDDGDGARHRQVSPVP